MITSNPFGAAAQQTATVTTGAGGDYSYAVNPSIQTTYRDVEGDQEPVRDHPRATEGDADADHRDATARGTRTYRVYLTRGQAGGGYLDSWSNSVRVHYIR